MTQPLDLRVAVDTVPEPGFLRPAIEAALAGRAWPPGPEAQIAAAVVAAMPGPYAGRTSSRESGSAATGSASQTDGIRPTSQDPGRGESS